MYSIPISAGFLQTATNEIENTLLNDKTITGEERELLKKLYRTVQSATCIADELTVKLKAQGRIK
jgi:hypothetical protein